MRRRRWSRVAAATLALGVACAMLPVLENTKGQQALPSVVAANVLRPVTAFDAIADERARATALARVSRAAITPPARCGTPASRRPISTPASVPASIRSLKAPR